MPKVSIELPRAELDAAVKKELSRLCAENAKLQRKNEELNRQIMANKEVVSRAKSVIDAVRSAGDFDCYQDDL